jgi:hypothetical protein
MLPNSPEQSNRDSSISDLFGQLSLRSGPINSAGALSGFSQDLAHAFASPYDPANAIQTMRQDPKLATLLDDVGCAGCSYSLEVHTTRVMRQFEKYFANIPPAGGLRPEVLRWGLALHDIGKPIALNHNRPQHECTLEVISHIAPHLPLSADELRIVIALIDGDPIGQCFQKFCSVTEARDEVIGMAARAGMQIMEFYELLTHYFQADTGAYTTDAGASGHLNHQFVFEPSSGLLQLHASGRRLVFAAGFEETYQAILDELQADEARRGSQVH